MKSMPVLLSMTLVLSVLFFAPFASSGVALKGIDVNETPPLELAWPFFDWEGVAEDFAVTNHWRRYYWEHEFHFTLKRDDGQRVKMVSRESTTFTDDWRFGPTYLPLEINWADKPRVRAIGVRLIDRHEHKFHNMALPAAACTPLLLYVGVKDRWEPWMINNWFHDWHKYGGRDAPEGHPGLANAELAQYYVDKPEPYDVFGHFNSIAADMYDENMKTAMSDGKRIRIYHGFLVSDAGAPRGYRIALKHLWTADYQLGFGEAASLRPRFTLPKDKEWNCTPP